MMQNNSTHFITQTGPSCFVHLSLWSVCQNISGSVTAFNKIEINIIPVYTAEGTQHWDHSYLVTHKTPYRNWEKKEIIAFDRIISLLNEWK